MPGAAIGLISADRRLLGRGPPVCSQGRDTPNRTLLWEISRWRRVFSFVPGKHCDARSAYRLTNH